VDVVRACRIHDIHGAVGEGDENAGVVVMVHGEGLIWKDGCPPNLDGLVLELVFAVGLHCGGLGADGGEEGE
jgi:hypothetical protein